MLFEAKLGFLGLNLSNLVYLKPTLTKLNYLGLT